MRNFSKRILAAAIAFTMVFTLMPSVSLTAYAKEDKIGQSSVVHPIKDTKEISNPEEKQNDKKDDKSEDESSEKKNDDEDIEKSDEAENQDSEVVQLTGDAKTVSVGKTKQIDEDTDGDDQEWSSSDTSVLTVSDGTITGEDVGTATVTHSWTKDGVKYVKTYSVTVKVSNTITMAKTKSSSDKVAVAVYVTDGTTTFSTNEAVKSALGMAGGYVQGDNYAPVGVIWLDESFFEGKNSPYINSASDWNTVKSSISEIDQSYLTNNGTKNVGNTVSSYLSLANYDTSGTAGSLTTALFDWDVAEACGGNIRLINGKNYKYHLDIRFSTNKVTFVGVSDKSNSIDLGYRVYLTNTTTAQPGTSDDWYLKSENIESGYQIEGYYSDLSCTTPYTFGGTLTSDVTVYVKLKKAAISVTYDLNGGTSTSFDGSTHTYENVEIGSSTPVPENVQKENYILQGWKDSEGNTYDSIPQQATKTTTYTAIWGDDKSNTFTVNYYLNNSNYAIKTALVDNDSDDDNIVGATVNASDYVETISGYTYAKASADSITIKSGSDNVINLYYYKNISINVPNKTVPYNGKKQEISVTADTVSGTIDGYAYDFTNLKTELTTSRETAGTDSINLKELERETDNSGYYFIESVSGGKLEVTKRIVYITVKDAQKYAGDADPEFTGTISTATDTTGLVDAEGELERLKLTYSRTNDTEEVGKYTGIITVSSGNENYELVVTNGDFEIKNKSDNTINFENLGDLIYSGENLCPSAVAGVSGSTIYYSTDGKTFSTTKPDCTEAGDYTVYAYATKKGYENTETISVRFTVAKRPVTITAEAASKAYGEKDPKFTGSITSGSLVNANDLGTISYKRTNTAENAGTYDDVIAASYTTNENYTVTVVPADFTITAIELTDDDLAFNISAGKSADVEYNGTSQTQPVVVTCDGKTLVEGTDYILTYSSDTTNAGTVTVTVEGKGNYSGTISKTYEITKKAVVITVTPMSKVYGEDDPKFTGTASGLVKDSDMTITYSRKGNDSKVGKYYGVLTASYEEADGHSNYSVTVKEADFEITKSDKNAINATEYSGTYDGDAHGLTEVSATQSGTTILYATSKDGEYSEKPITYTDAGTYSIWVKATNPNFEDVVVEKHINITKKAATVTPNDVTITYGQTVPENSALTYVTDGVNPGESLGTISCAVGSYENKVGSYNVITATVTNANPNYNIIVNTGKLTIEANTDISVNDLSNVIYDGNEQKQEESIVVKSGDTTLVKDQDYTVTYERVAADGDNSANDNITNAGTIKVTITGINNYAGGSTNTTYVIEKRKATITVSNKAKTYGEDDSAIACSSEISNLAKTGDISVTSYTFAEHSENASDTAYADVIDCVYTENSNYEVTVVKGNLTIAKAGSLTVAASDREVTYTGEKFNISDVSTNVTEGTTITYCESKNGTYLTAESFAGFADAGTYTVYVKAENPNYDTATGSATLTINKKQISVVATVSEASVTYGDKDPAVTVTVKDSAGDTITVNGLNPGYTVSGDAARNVGTYTVTPTYTELSNYEVTSTGSLFTITPKEIKSVAALADVVYDGQSHEVNDVYVSDGSKTLDPANYTVSNSSDTTNVGAVTVTVTGTGNYTGTISKTFNITKRPLTITADSATKEYDGTALTKASYTVAAATKNTGLVEGESVSSATVSGSQTIVGKSANAVSNAVFAEGTSASNYSVTYVAGELEVTSRATKYSITVTPNSGEAKYDGTLKTVSGLYGASTDTEQLGLFSKITNALGLTDQVEVESSDEEELVFTINGAKFTLTGLTASGAGIEVGEYEVKTSGTAKIVDENNNDVTDQFYVNITELGKLTISDQFHNITIHYVDEDGNRVASDYSGAYAENRNYSYTSPSVDGYTASRGTIYILATDKLTTDLELTVVYSKDAVAADDSEDSDDSTGGDDSTGSSDGTEETTDAGQTSTSVTPSATVDTADADDTNAGGNAATGDNAQITVNDEPVPQNGRVVLDDDGNAEIVDIADDEVAKFADGSFWALMNLICTVVGAIYAIYLFILLFRKNKKKDEEEEEAEVAKAETEDEEEDDDEIKKDNKLLKVLSIVTAIASVLVFIFTENMSNPMRFFDKWTILMAILLIVEILFAFFSRKKTSDDDKDKEDEVEIAQ